MEQAPGAWLKEGERIQIVIFMRHGVASHNLLDPMTGRSPDLYDPALWDPSLVERGMKEALTVRERITHYINRMDLVVCSPLTRCLQTAHLVFFPGTAYDARSNPIPVVCLEQIREAAGMHYPDKRRDKRFLQLHWPFIQFDPAMSSIDEIWSESSRETLEDVVSRVNKFLEWLVQREEVNVFVVSHGVWIECCFEAHCPGFLQHGKRVYNCDCFIGEVVSKDAAFVRMQNLKKL